MTSLHAPTNTTWIHVARPLSFAWPLSAVLAGTLLALSLNIYHPQAFLLVLFTSFGLHFSGVLFYQHQQQALTLAQSSTLVLLILITALGGFQLLTRSSITIDGNWLHWIIAFSLLLLLGWWVFHHPNRAIIQGLFVAAVSASWVWWAFAAQTHTLPGDLWWLFAGQFFLTLAGWELLAKRNHHSHQSVLLWLKSHSHYGYLGWIFGGLLAPVVYVMTQPTPTVFHLLFLAFMPTLLRQSFVAARTLRAESLVIHAHRLMLMQLIYALAFGFSQVAFSA